MTDLHRLAACSACGRQFDVSDSPDLAHLGAGESFACSCGATVTVPAARPQDAAVVACSACGAPREGGAAACTFCGSGFTLRELDLDAICPRCFARVSRRGRFCHHCAVPLTAPRSDGAPADHRCPTCPAPEGTTGRMPAAEGDGRGERRALVSRRLDAAAAVPVFECRGCAGLWLDREVFELLAERVQRRRAGLPGGNGGSPPAGGAPSPAALPPLPGGGAAVAAEQRSGWSYRPCSVCGQLMNRRNYARKSGVILDVCKNHGLWFDAEELHRVLEWIRDGGPTDADVEAARRLREERGRSGGGGLGRGVYVPNDEGRGLLDGVFGGLTFADVILEMAGVLGDLFTSRR